MSFQQTVEKWQRECWGENSPERVTASVSKVIEEFEEFFRAFDAWTRDRTGDNRVALIDETADLVITAYGFAARFGFDLDAARDAKFAKVQQKYRPMEVNGRDR